MLITYIRLYICDCVCRIVFTGLIILVDLISTCTLLLGTKLKFLSKSATMLAIALVLAVMMLLLQSLQCKTRCAEKTNALEGDVLEGQSLSTGSSALLPERYGDPSYRIQAKNPL